MDEIEKAAREQLILWEGQLDALLHQRTEIGKSLSEVIDKITDPNVKMAFNQISIFICLTDQITGIQTMHSSLDHLLQNHNDEGIDGRHGYH